MNFVRIRLFKKVIFLLNKHFILINSFKKIRYWYSTLRFDRKMNRRCDNCQFSYKDADYIDGIHICYLPCCGYIGNDLRHPCGELVTAAHRCTFCRKHIHAIHGYKTEIIQYNICHLCFLSDLKTQNLHSESDSILTFASRREHPLPTQCKAILKIIKGPELGSKRKCIGEIEYSFILSEG